MAHSNGHLRATVIPSREPVGVSTSDAGMRFVRNMLDSLTIHGERCKWPAEESGDSVRFRIDVEPASVRPDGRRILPTSRAAYPFSMLAVPTTEEVRATHQQRPRYPDELRRDGYPRTVTLEYVVDEAGTVTASSIRGIPVRSAPALGNGNAGAYLLFLQAISTALVGSRYEPTRLSGCAVPRLVRQRFDFRLLASLSSRLIRGVE